jgi:hypothetical protein
MGKCKCNGDKIEQVEINFVGTMSVLLDRMYKHVSQVRIVEYSIDAPGEAQAIPNKIYIRFSNLPTVTNSGIPNIPNGTQLNIKSEPIFFGGNVFSRVYRERRVLCTFDTTKQDFSQIDVCVYDETGIAEIKPDPSSSNFSPLPKVSMLLEIVSIEEKRDDDNVRTRMDSILASSETIMNSGVQDESFTTPNMIYHPFGLNQHTVMNRQPSTMQSNPNFVRRINQKQNNQHL